MPVNFSTVEAETAHAGVKVLCYGGAGLGKTMMCATLPGLTVVVSAEAGLLSLRRQNLERLYGVNTPGINYNLHVLVIRSMVDFNDALAWLQQSAESRAIESVALDSISEIGEVCLNNAKRTVKDPRQAYGELGEKMETAIRAYRDLPGKNVYFSAKQAAMKDELTGVVQQGPSMPGQQLGQKLPYFFDEVFRLGVNKDAQGNPYRFLQTQPDIQNTAKDRSGALAVMEPPHLGHIFAKIKGL